MNVHLRELAAAQADLVASWQLVDAGWTRRMIEQQARNRGWRRVHSGVYALTQAPLTRRQLWFAATLTTRDSVLSHASAADCWGFRTFKGRFQTIIRPGSGGRKRAGSVLVYRSKSLAGDTTMRDGMPITTAARTLVDLAPGLRPRDLARALREALRLGVTSVREVLDAVARHRGRRGTTRLAELARRYAGLDYRRTRSNAEARALEVLHDAGIQAPHVNLRIAGEEADLVWLRDKLIIEIDGPQYHRFADEDARKQGRWEAAGFVVRRISSAAVYDQPGRLVELATTGAPGSRTGRRRAA